MENFGKFCFTIFALVVSAMIGGYILMKLYTWYVVPVFQTPSMGLAQSIGVSFFISYLKWNKKSTDKKQDWDEMMQDFFVSIFMALMYFGFAWIFTFFI